MSNALETNLNQAINLLNKSQATQYEIELSHSEGLSTRVRLSKTESVQKYLNVNIGITCFLGQKTGYASGSDLSKQGLSTLMDNALSIAKYTEPDPFSGLADKQRMAWEYPDLALYQPYKPSIDLMTEQAKVCEAAALEIANINNSEGAEFSSLYGHSYYANSLGLMVNRRSSRHSLSCSVIASQDGQQQTAYDYHSAITFGHLLNSNLIGQNAAQYALEKLNSRNLKSQTCPVIFSSKVSSSLLNHLLKALDGTNQYKKSSFLLNSLDKIVAPTWLDIQEIPLQKGVMGARAYDSDGVLKQTQYFLKQGVVQTYVMGQYSANQLKLSSTGNAGGTSNCYVSSNLAGSLPTLIKQMDKGLLVTELMGQGVNMTTGNYSRGAAGFWVENGQIQHPVSGVTIAGNLSEMLTDISAITPDVDERCVIKVGSILIEKMTLSGQ